MGEVWKAHDPRLNRDVAIKVSAAQFGERFEREAKAIAALNHPNICQIYDQPSDFFKDPLPACDAYMIRKVIHDWSNRESVEILPQVRHETGGN